MSNSFIVTIDSKVIHQYEETRNPARLRRYLDELDLHMEEGVQLGEIFVNNPDTFQKQQYIAMLLIQALDENNSNNVNVYSAYLLRSGPDLSEVNVSLQGDMCSLKLITSTHNKEI